MKLRKLEIRDVPLILEWMKDPEIYQFFKFDPDSISPQSVLNFVENSWTDKKNKHFAVTEKGDEYLGTISLKNIENGSCEYAVGFRKKAINKGFGTKATREILRIAFYDLDLETVFLHVLEDNIRAIRMYEKNGFKVTTNFDITMHKSEQKLITMTVNKNQFEKIAPINRAYKMTFSQKGDERGHLVVAECGKEIPFDIKRIFYMYDSDSTVIRGQHANKNSEFVIINICGSSKIRVSDSKNEQIFELNQAHHAVYIPKMLWKDMYDFSKDSIMLVLSSQLYDPDEYIRDFNEYIKLLEE